jgi:hypothetical protein
MSNLSAFSNATEDNLTTPTIFKELKNHPCGLAPPKS